MALPSFLCIGAQKAGTSWLFEQLRTHPMVWMPPVKELHYFDYLYTEDSKKWAGWHIKTSVANAIKWHMNTSNPPNLAYVHYLSGLATQQLFSENWYRAAFDWHAAAGKVLGDITPEYSTIGPQGIAYLKSLLPDTKIVYVLRDPLDRALSQLKMNISRQPIDLTSDAAWDEAASAPAITNRGAYATYIPQWLEAFPVSQIKFMPYKQIGRDPESFLCEIEAFLGLSFHSYKKARTPVHVTQPIAVPDRIKQMLCKVVQMDTDFLYNHFGSDFAKST